MESSWRDLLKGFIDHGLMPVRLSKSFILACINGIDTVDVDVLLSSFANSSVERSATEKAAQCMKKRTCLFYLYVFFNYFIVIIVTFDALLVDLETTSLLHKFCVVPLSKSHHHSQRPLPKPLRVVCLGAWNYK